MRAMRNTAGQRAGVAKLDTASVANLRELGYGG